MIREYKDLYNTGLRIVKHRSQKEKYIEETESFMFFKESLSGTVKKMNEIADFSGEVDMVKLRRKEWNFSS